MTETADGIEIEVSVEEVLALEERFYQLGE